MMLKKTIVLEADASNPSEDSTTHEVVCIRAESVYDVVVIPDVHLGYCGICRSERLCGVPFGIVVEVIFITTNSHRLVKWVVSPLLRIANISLRFEGSCSAHSVIVDLVSSTNHDMKRTLLMYS